MIGIFGGSAFYDLLENPQEVEADTPYGKPSGKVMVGEFAGKKVAFLPRHGQGHSYPPHEIPYKANLYAFKELGVKRIVGPCASGSLQPEIRPGDFVICDQFVDRTNGRKCTYFDGPDRPDNKYHKPGIAHISTADPYCLEMRELAIKSCENLGIPVHGKGTVVVVNGPRFSTRAESKWFQSRGWEVINMTQYPECVLARELGMCYVNISLITDYDAGLEGNSGIKPVTSEEVVRTFRENNAKLRKLLLEMIKNMPEEASCSCGKALEDAYI